MADNVDITPGSGVTIATDDISNVHYQRVKIVGGALGVDTPIGSDAVDGGDHALWVRDRADKLSAVVDSSGLTTATTTYTSGDVLGVGWEFPNFARVGGGGGSIRGITLIDTSDVMGAYDLAFFGEAATFGTDNAALAISDAEIAKCQQWLTSMTAPLDVGGARIGSVPAQSNANFSYLNIPIVCVGTSMFVYAVTRSANAVFAGGADSLKLRITWERW